MLDWTHHKFLKLNFLHKLDLTLHKNHNTDVKKGRPALAS